MAGQSGAEIATQSGAEMAGPSGPEMASHSDADPGTSSAATEAPAPPVKKPADELLCTICGLTACWTSPGKPPRPATAADGPATEASTPG